MIVFGINSVIIDIPIRTVIVRFYGFRSQIVQRELSYTNGEYKYDIL